MLSQPTVEMPQKREYGRLLLTLPRQATMSTPLKAFQHDLYGDATSIRLDETVKKHSIATYDRLLYSYEVRI